MATPSSAIAPGAAHALPAADVLATLGSGPSGLDEREAADRLRRYGPNALRAAPPASAWRILVAQFRSVVVLLLIVAAVVSLVVGDVLDALVIGGVLALNALLGFTVEIRARRAMESLLRLEAAHAVVLRAGRAREIDARELVPGDVIEVEPGRAVPADARFLEGADVRTQEAALTGESLPVVKSALPVSADTPLAERSDMLYQGTSVVAGTGRAVVVATGDATEIGRIGALVGAIRSEPTPLERRLDALGRRLVWLALSVGALVAVLGALRGMPWVELLKTGLALAVAAVPEGLPAVATVALALGVHRMARRRALVRRLPSVETLGSVTVICTDKTGTLTAGEPTATVIATAEAEVAVTGSGYAPIGALCTAGDPLAASGAESAPPLAEPLASTLRIAVLANRAGVVRDGERWTAQGDPTEAALVVLGLKAGLRRDDLVARWPQLGELPFSSERMLMATYHRSPGDGALIAHAKGAPGRILDLCERVLTAHGERPLDAAERRALLARNEDLAARGLRVLALALGPVSGNAEPELRRLAFAGFVGMTDPVAPGVADSVRSFRGAGIRTVMITGDQERTAAAIGGELGIVDREHGVLDGRALARLDDAALAARIGSLGAFSRVSPEDKLRIVRAFQAGGDIVAMLGDGVNDAAALRKSDVGVAMGGRGTDVAKEAADVVLQDDRFATIGSAIEEGRVVFDNIRKFVFYLFSCNVAEVLVVLAGSAVLRDLPLLPLQILWLNLVTDTFPALALALEPGEAGVMRRPPRDPAEALFSRAFLRDVAIFATLITAVTLVAFLAGGGGDGDAARAVTMSFVTLALAQLFHLGNARSRGRVTRPAEVVRNPWALGAVALVLALQVASVHFAPLADVLGTRPLGAREWLVVLVLAGLPAMVGQAAKPAPEARAAATAAARRARPR